MLDTKDKFKNSTYTIQKVIKLEADQSNFLRTDLQVCDDIFVVYKGFRSDE
ncbi:hypothetical protein OSO01_23360 [Oceanobacillus sojae]|uniref:Uncharacterized protein n=1 Tax=Oceanobacillus sojae TaxID=582851 RepID=A0A511ZJI9_9BACI|nr:hypothetical protein OSO01_23360 [Oceanobacillus sojae]